MTRLTNEMRASMVRRIMHGLPNINYDQQIYDLIQKVIVENAPEPIKAAYAVPECHAFLNEASLEVRAGRSSRDGFYKKFKALSDYTVVRMDERVYENAKDGSLQKAIHVALRDSGLMAKRQEQNALRKSIEERLKATLASVTTIKRLYDVLEPELHKFIPPETPTTKSGTALTVSAPVVDDLKKLGFGV